MSRWLSIAAAVIALDQATKFAVSDWLAGGEAPSAFTIDRDCELKSMAEDKAAIRYVRHPQNIGLQVRQAGLQPGSRRPGHYDRGRHIVPIPQVRP